MALIVNTSAAKISAATKIVWNKPNAEGRKTIKIPGKMYDFVPGIMTAVNDKAWAQLKTVRLIAESLDNGVLLDGKEAKRVADRAKKATKEVVESEAKEGDDDEPETGGDNDNDDLLD